MDGDTENLEPQDEGGPQAEAPAEAPAPAAAGATDHGRKTCYVLFIDVVGFSTRTLDEKEFVVDKLRKTVQSTKAYKTYQPRGKLVSKDTGDGMLLAFLEDPLAPIECAVDVAGALRDDPRFAMRLGINSGLATVRENIQGQNDITGGAVDHAARVMDCGDSGHILLSGAVAGDAHQTEDFWPYVTKLGEATVKHGEKLPIFNLCSEKWGNPACPKKLFQPDKHRMGVIAGVLAPIVAALPWIRTGGANIDFASFAPSWLFIAVGVALAAAMYVFVKQAYRGLAGIATIGKAAVPFAVLSALIGGVGLDPCKLNPDDAVCIEMARVMELSYKVEIWLLGDQVQDPPVFEPKISQNLFYPAGSGISVHVESAQEGFLYILNQAPHEAGQIPDFGEVFPAAEVHRGQSGLQSGDSINVADLQFDEQQGDEKLFPVWSAKPVDLLENLKTDENGRLTDGAQVTEIEAFLLENLDRKAEPVLDGDAVRLSRQDQLFVHPARVRHDLSPAAQGRDLRPSRA